MPVYNTRPFVSVVVTVATATQAVAATTAIPTNCHTLIVYNSHATQDLYVGTGTVGNPLDASRTIVPAQSSVTLSIGPLSLRVGSSAILYDASGNNTIAYVTYVCGLEG